LVKTDAKDDAKVAKKDLVAAATNKEAHLDQATVQGARKTNEVVKKSLNTSINDLSGPELHEHASEMGVIGVKLSPTNKNELVACEGNEEADAFYSMKSGGLDIVKNSNLYKQAVGKTKEEIKDLKARLRFRDKHGNLHQIKKYGAKFISQSKAREISHACFYVAAEGIRRATEELRKKAEEARRKDREAAAENAKLEFRHKLEPAADLKITKSKVFGIGTKFNKIPREVRLSDTENDNSFRDKVKMNNKQADREWEIKKKNVREIKKEDVEKKDQENFIQTVDSGAPATTIGGDLVEEKTTYNASTNQRKDVKRHLLNKVDRVFGGFSQTNGVNGKDTEMRNRKVGIVNLKGMNGEQKLNNLGMKA
jgi:hypothetical protein